MDPLDRGGKRRDFKAAGLMWMRAAEHPPVTIASRTGQRVGNGQKCARSHGYVARPPSLLTIRAHRSDGAFP
eukprot:9479478-Pyramimonas_sp.AAC.4